MGQKHLNASTASKPRETHARGHMRPCLGDEAGGTPKPPSPGPCSPLGTPMGCLAHMPPAPPTDPCSPARSAHWAQTHSKISGLKPQGAPNHPDQHPTSHHPLHTDPLPHHTAVLCGAVLPGARWDLGEVHDQPSLALPWKHPHLPKGTTPPHPTEQPYNPSALLLPAGCHFHLPGLQGAFLR